MSNNYYQILTAQQFHGLLKLDHVSVDADKLRTNYLTGEKIVKYKTGTNKRKGMLSHKEIKEIIKRKDGWNREEVG